MNRMSPILKIYIACIFAMLAGCKQNSSTPIEPASLVTYQPKGTITGLIVNRITNTPVKGAVISVGYDGGVQSVPPTRRERIHLPMYRSDNIRLSTGRPFFQARTHSPFRLWCTTLVKRTQPRGTETTIMTMSPLPSPRLHRAIHSPY